MTDFEKYLFSAFRTVVIKKVGSHELTDNRLLMAVTANENLGTLGFSMGAEALMKLATSDSLETVYKDIDGIGDMHGAKPMYPDFPTTLMNIDEATFRFHQICHYTSTYGLERWYGVKIKKGWLPDTPDTAKTEKDDALLNLKFLTVVDESDAYRYCLEKVLSKKERMSQDDKTYVAIAYKHELGKPRLSELQVSFKQNLMALFAIAFDSLETQDFIDSMKVFCKHTGDVWKCADYLITHKRFHLRTSEKRKLVRLFESYGAGDFRENLQLSIKKGERIIKLLTVIDFNRFSKNPEFSEAIRGLRTGELKSFEAQVDALLKLRSEEALDFLAKRPGLMLRKINRLIKLGYGEYEILSRLLPVAGKLSAQTLNTCLVFFGHPFESYERERLQIYNIFLRLMEEKMKHVDTGWQGKKVYIDEGDVDLSRSTIAGNDKSALTGYLQSGFAYRIPDEATTVRFFVYWNSTEERADLDLHAEGYFDGREESVHIGWNGEFRDSGMATSGDITHSNAAEYIDVDLRNGELPHFVRFVVDDFYTEPKHNFTDLSEGFTGMMAVEKLGVKVQLYDRKNCFFNHDITALQSGRLEYAWLDTKLRRVIFVGKEYLNKGSYTELGYDDVTKILYSEFSARRYLELLIKAQNATLADSADTADVVLSLEKKDNTVSIVEKNYWLDV
ncbi:MAG: hypothetical protein J5717_06995 [Lachnospiraceae bacterium]|nr:hypothetical protein [Lachnospiraceae bacterium]